MAKKKIVQASNKVNTELQNRITITPNPLIRQSIYNSIFTGLSAERLSYLLRASTETANTQDYLTLAEEMEERDPHYRSVLNTRKQQIVALPIVVKSIGEDELSKKLQEFVENIVQKPKFKKMLFDLLDALSKGYSVVEPIYEIKNNLLVPQRYIHRKPQWFTFDLEGIDLLLRESLNVNISIPKIKAIKHIPQLKTGLPIRGGLARVVAAMFLLKNYGVKDWASFLDIYGIPLRVGKYDPNACEEEDIKTLMRAVADIATDGAAVIPLGAEIEFINGNASGNNGALFVGYLEYLDKQISKAVLGQTMTTDDGSSRSQSEVHNEVREDIKIADAIDLAETINEWLEVLIEYNFGQQEYYPAIEFNTSKPEDRAILANMAEQAVNMGMKISESDTRNRLGFKAPLDDNDILKPSQIKVPAEALPESVVSLNSDYEVPQSEYVEDISIKNNWQKIIEPLEEQLNQALESSSTEEEAINNITSLSLNTKNLETDLAKATTKEYLAGLKGEK